MNSKQGLPLCERRARIAGGIGGLLLSICISILILVFANLWFNARLNGWMVVGWTLVIGTTIGAVFPRIGLIALQIAGSILSNVN